VGVPSQGKNTLLLFQVNYLMSKKTISIVLIVFFIALCSGFMFIYYPMVKESRAPGLGFWGANQGPSVRPFKFVNQQGDTITEQDVKGKILVVEYFFATCKSICPKMNENMAKVYQAYRTNENVLILSHTVDPKNDTVAALKAYSLRYDADPKRWMFLTGDKQALYDHARFSYQITAMENTAEHIDEDFIHEKYFVLVDKQGRLRAHKEEDGAVSLYDGTDEKSVAQLIKDIKILEEEE
jgi:protein SCO1/2